MHQLVTLILMALLGAPPQGLAAFDPKAPLDAPATFDDMGIDDEQLEQGFDVDEFDFSPMDKRLLNKKMGEGDLTSAIEKLRAIAKKRRSQAMAPVKRPLRLMPAEGTYGEEVVFDAYGRPNRRD